MVGTLSQLVYAPRDPALLQRAFADPAIRLVTLTITVGGYCADASAGSTQAAWRRTIAVGASPHGHRLARGGPSATVAKQGLPPPVVLSCDNLPSNGRLLRQVCIDMAALHDDRLSAWIAGHVQFPSTMVDRIVPVSTAVDRQDASAILGLVDAAPVCAEPFHQWVIERFDGPRPRWDAAGAEYVADVGPWEASKLRLLNGGHLAVACLGRLAGCETIADAMAVPGFAAFALRFMIDEQKPTLPPSDHDIDAYARQLLARWRSRGIAAPGRTRRPRRLVQAAGAPARVAEGQPAGAPAGALHRAGDRRMDACVAGRDDAGRPIA